MISIENLDFLREEVIVTKLNIKEELGLNDDPFSQSALPQDRSNLIMVKVIKVGDKQHDIFTGDILFVSEQSLEKIVIQGVGVLENTFKIISGLGVYSKYKK